MYQVFPSLSTPKSKLFFDRPKQHPIAEFDVLFGSVSDRPLTHKSKKAASTPCSVGIFPSFTNHATTCLTVNCSIALEASATICLSCRKDATTLFVKKFSFPRIKFDRPKICSWPRILRFTQNSHQRPLQQFLWGVALRHPAGPRRAFV